MERPWGVLAERNRFLSKEFRRLKHNSALTETSLEVNNGDGLVSLFDQRGINCTFVKPVVITKFLRAACFHVEPNNKVLVSLDE